MNTKDECFVCFLRSSRQRILRDRFCTVVVALFVILVFVSCATRAIRSGDQPPEGYGTAYFVVSLAGVDSATVLIGKQGELFALPKARIDLRQGDHLYAVFLDSNYYEFNSFIDGKFHLGYNDQLSVQPKNPENPAYENRGYCDPFVLVPGNNIYAGALVFIVEKDGFTLYCDRSDSTRQSAKGLFSVQFPELRKKYPTN